MILAQFSYFVWLINGKTGFAPSIAKQKFICDIAKQASIKTFIETGTYMGDMVSAVRSYFEKVYSIELAQTYYKAAIKRFKKYSNVSIISGDSGVELPKILSQLSGPAIFWLDGHYSGGDTAKSTENSPLRKEIESILLWKFKTESILIIDDVNSLSGSNGYPTVDEIKDIVQRAGLCLSTELDGNILVVKN